MSQSIPSQEISASMRPINFDILDQEDEDDGSLTDIFFERNRDSETVVERERPTRKLDRNNEVVLERERASRRREEKTPEKAPPQRAPVEHKTSSARGERTKAAPQAEDTGKKKKGSLAALMKNVGFKVKK